MDNAEGKRISLKRKVPNPVFQEWLEELYKEASAKKSKLAPTLQVALTSLSKYPLPLKTGADCAILQGFDKRLCDFFDKRLEVYNSQNSSIGSDCSSDSEDSTPCNGNLKTKSSKQSSQCSLSSQDENVQTQNSTSSSKSNNNSVKSRKYKPVFRSGSYAILLALLDYSKENPSNPVLKKNELIDKAQKYSEESFTRPKPGTFYTAWSNMSKLVNKGLVKQTRSKVAHFSLTQSGVLLGTELLEETKNMPTVNDIIFNGGSTSSVVVPRTLQSQATSSLNPVVILQKFGSSSLPYTYVTMRPGSFDIILLIDKQETGGVSKKKDPTVAQFNKYPDLKREFRSLKVGDFMWIARDKTNENRELVLPYIVERKRMDDLGASIKDGRFHEQKFRLKKCGLKNVLYLVENFGSNSHVGLPIKSLKQAIANTKVQDGFKVHVTDFLTGSVKFLAMMTKRLTIEYKDKCLQCCNQETEGEQLMTFDYFNKSAMKNKTLTVTEMFIKMLLQLKGVSVEKALAITKVYKTPSLLIHDYEMCDKEKGETLLAHLKYSEENQKVGPAISKAIYLLFT